MAPTASLIDRIESMPKRELYFFALYRLLIATVIAALLFSPLAGMVGEPYHPVMAAAVSGTYLACALLLLLLGRSGRAMRSIVLLGVGVDIVAATLLAHALPGASAGISMSLLFNIAAAATLLPLTLGMSLALGASAATVAEYLWKLLEGGAPTRTLAELAMFATSYLALAYISFQVANRARQNQQLANERGDEVANLFQINELIIRRMRTGVLVVDGNNRITLANEAASTLLGDDEGIGGERLQRGSLPPELARRLQRWRGGWNQEETPLELSPDHPDVQPRFARLLAGSDLTLVFLDDSSVVSRRAESLTLSALGRFSASLAHEIRNPLAAINYAVQLLEEEDANFNASDRRLLEIIRLQCQRTNGIVESVLGLARRERANPENVDLVAFVRRFVLEYRQGLSLETDSVEPIISSTSVAAQVDPRHLHQMLTALVHNALKYGRIGEQPARVRLRVALQERSPVIDVMDRGPGIPAPVVAQLFSPFFTTSEHGTGLGLYIARELCRANQARLDYVPVPAGGACFRLTLAAPHTLLPG